MSKQNVFQTNVEITDTVLKDVQTTESLFEKPVRSVGFAGYICYTSRLLRFIKNSTKIVLEKSPQAPLPLKRLSEMHLENKNMR